MPSPSRIKTVPLGWLSDGMFLTIATFFAAVANYLFQALMRRHLPWSEFGYLNSTLSLIFFTGVPLTAASQTVTHYLAQIRASGDEERMIRVQAASLKFLRHLTWVLFALSLVLLYPVSAFLHFPRMSLAWAALLWIPVNLWNALGSGWCAGLSRFRLLSILLIVTAIVRLVSGAILADFYPWAESGVFAGMLSGLVLAGVVVNDPHHGKSARLRRALLNPELLVYGLAALAVSFGAFAFLQGDQMVAQRHFPGDELGRYSGAGLLGRAVIWMSLPVLTIYFTRRSGHDSSRKSPAPLLWIYLAMLSAGAIGLIVVKVPVLILFLGSHDSELTQMTTYFALTMVPLGILQLLGYHYLAARKIPECLLFGVCGLAYIIALVCFGKTPFLMLGWMAASAMASVVVLSGLSLTLKVRRS